MSSGGKVKTRTQDTTPQYIRDQNIANIALANQIAAKPYTAYAGQRIANLNPFQQQAADAAGALGQSGQGLAQRGFNLLGGIGSAADRISAYQNPFTNEVIDRSMSDLERQRQITGTADSAKAVAAKAFGGSRQAVQNALTNEAYARQAGDMSANLRYQGFNTALGAAQQDVQQQQGLAQALQAAGYGALGQAGQAGDFLRGFNQQGLDQAYGDFLDKENYDLKRLGILQSAVQNAPFQTSTSQSQGPDRVGQGLQIAGIAAAAF
jgi:hypothetical protein